MGPGCLNGAGHNGFDAGNIHYKGHWKGRAQKIETFLGPEMATNKASAIWAQKSRETRMRTRIQFFTSNVDPDPVFHLNVDPDPDPVFLLNADPDPVFH
jgi:hypothetical protein